MLDTWILGRLNEVIARVTQNFADYDAYRATLAIQDLIEDLTNWYIRRSRRRFWKSEDDADKADAYATLYAVLLDFAKIAAPFVPFRVEIVPLLRDYEPFHKLGSDVGTNCLFADQHVESF